MAKRSSKGSALNKAYHALTEAARGYPEAREEHPWGHRVFKVRGKIFVFLDLSEDGSLYLGVKLPQTSGMALMFPFVEPMGYGMAKAGWVSVSFKPREDVPVEMMLQWLDESYRAVAPKRLAASFDAGSSAPRPASAAASKPPKVRR